MATSTTKTLNIGYVLASSIDEQPITPIGRCGTAQIIAVGQNVTQWSANEKILYKTDDAISFKEDDTYILIPENSILFSYISEAAP